MFVGNLELIGFVKILAQPLPGVYHLQPPFFPDDRGCFVKTFHAPAFAQVGLSMIPRESFYSRSTAGVLRGMHFQTPPAAHQKLVCCVVGRVLDVLVDLRAGGGFGRTWSVTLNAEEPTLLWIAPGIAHGFLSLTDQSCVHYTVDREHAPQNDAGVRWDSIDFDWPLPSAPSLSPRDLAHPRLDQFNTPFGPPGK